MLGIESLANLFKACFDLNLFLIANPVFGKELESDGDSCNCA